uniref:Uncharacterized protein n=1 Tax=Fagus sylvatica TaxID=28930 RepID=A0A2N9G6C8_FAGSY
METTEYQEGIQLAADLVAKNHATFEDQLREIDMAINFNSVISETSGTVDKAKSNGPEEELGPASPIMPKTKVSLSTKDPRSPLGDITNNRAVISPKPTVGTWKKMARAKGQGSQDTRKFAVAEKRACEEVMQIEEEDMRTPPNPMSCLSWNCRGLGNPGTVQELANMVRVKAPSAVFLMETWSNEEYLEKVRCYLHFNSKLVVQSNNKGGGLVLYWNDDLNLAIKSYSSNHIDATINEGTETAWRLTGVYGAPETHRREETWNLLRHLDNMFKLPWCCIGDFNEIVKLEEMKGRLARPDCQMRRFRSALDDCGLVDLRYRGFPFTWCNNRDPPFTTWVRLDRAVANIGWPFRFEESWMTDVGCETTIKKAWEMTKSGTRMFMIEVLKQKIQQAETLSIQDRQHENINGLRRELNLLLGKEEHMWRQRSRISWLTMGDRNTKYFHGRASQRRRRNLISRLSDDRGGWLESNEGIAGKMIEYYTTLFTTSHPTNMVEAVTNVPKVVSVEMNNSLTREFKAEEVEQAIKQMAPSKAPGPDVKNPEKVTDFHPISLCNVIYKLVAKVLANRLKLILPQIVSDSQSAFVPGRLITDNVLIAFETLHHMHHNKMGRKGAMALKLDMSKAYDRVEWCYLEQIMKNMGFHQKWIGLMLACISSVSYSVLINGEFNWEPNVPNLRNCT